MEQNKSYGVSSGGVLGGGVSGGGTTVSTEPVSQTPDDPPAEVEPSDPKPDNKPKPKPSEDTTEPDGQGEPAADDGGEGSPTDDSEPRIPDITEDDGSGSGEWCGNDEDTTTGKGDFFDENKELIKKLKYVLEFVYPDSGIDLAKLLTGGKGYIAMLAGGGKPSGSDTTPSPEDPALSTDPIVTSPPSGQPKPAGQTTPTEQTQPDDDKKNKLAYKIKIDKISEPIEEGVVDLDNTTLYEFFKKKIISLLVGIDDSGLLIHSKDKYKITESNVKTKTIDNTVNGKTYYYCTVKKYVHFIFDGISEREFSTYIYQNAAGRSEKNLVYLAGFFSIFDDPEIITDDRNKTLTIKCGRIMGQVEIEHLINLTVAACNCITPKSGNKECELLPDIYKLIEGKKENPTGFVADLLNIVSVKAVEKIQGIISSARTLSVDKMLEYVYDQLATIDYDHFYIQVRNEVKAFKEVAKNKPYLEVVRYCDYQLHLESRQQYEIINEEHKHNGRWLVHSWQAGLTLKYTVCSGFAEALYLIMQTLGVDIGFCNSSNNDHAWNFDYQKGVWYDVTWDIYADKSEQFSSPSNYATRHEYFGVKNNKRFPHGFPDVDNSKVIQCNYDGPEFDFDYFISNYEYKDYSDPGYTYDDILSIFK